MRKMIRQYDDNYNMGSFLSQDVFPEHETGGTSGIVSQFVRVYFGDIAHVHGRLRMRSIRFDENPVLRSPRVDVESIHRRSFGHLHLGLPPRRDFSDVLHNFDIFNVLRAMLPKSCT